MISGPRNISTAMLYSFDNRPDCTGVDEPFYGDYLTRFPEINHPGRMDILKSMQTQHQQVIDDIYSQVDKSTLLFIKNMSHHIADADLKWMQDHKVFMLIRDPARVIRSFTKVIANPTPTDIGIIQQWNIYQTLTEMGLNVPVVNTDKFLQSPETQMPLLCQAIDIPYHSAMLQWKPGARAVDGIWAPHWYQSVHQSSGFKKTTYTKPPAVEARYLPIYDAVLPSYQELERRSL